MLISDSNRLNRNFFLLLYQKRLTKSFVAMHKGCLFFKRYNISWILNCHCMYTSAFWLWSTSTKEKVRTIVWLSLEFILFLEVRHGLKNVCEVLSKKNSKSRKISFFSLNRSWIVYVNVLIVSFIYYKCLWKT